MERVCKHVSRASSRARRAGNERRWFSHHWHHDQWSLIIDHWSLVIDHLCGGVGFDIFDIMTISWGWWFEWSSIIIISLTSHNFLHVRRVPGRVSSWRPSAGLLVLPEVVSMSITFFLSFCLFVFSSSCFNSSYVHVHLMSWVGGGRPSSSVFLF